MEDNDNISSTGASSSANCEKRQSSLVWMKRQNNKQHSRSSENLQDEEANNLNIDGKNELHDIVIQMDISTSETDNQNGISTLSSNNYDVDNDVDMYVNVASTTTVKQEEFKFDPTAASTSKSRNNSPPTASFSPSSYKSALSTQEEDQFQFNSTDERKKKTIQS